MVSIVQEQGHHLTSVTRVIWLGPQHSAPQSKGPDWNGLLCSVSAILHRQKVGPSVDSPGRAAPRMGSPKMGSPRMGPLGWAPSGWAPLGWASPGWASPRWAPQVGSPRMAPQDGPPG